VVERRDLGFERHAVRIEDRHAAIQQEAVQLALGEDAPHPGREARLREVDHLARRRGSCRKRRRDGLADLGVDAMGSMVLLERGSRHDDSPDADRLAEPGEITWREAERAQQGRDPGLGEQDGRGIEAMVEKPGPWAFVTQERPQARQRGHEEMAVVKDASSRDCLGRCGVRGKA
jgi:hypothetical protein